MTEPNLRMVWEKSGERLIDNYTNITAEINETFMTCINTYDSTFFLQIDNLIKYIVFTPVKAEKFRVVVRNGASSLSSYVRMYFGNTNFKNNLPPKFYPVIDNGIEYKVSCRPIFPFHIDYKLITVFILI